MGIPVVLSACALRALYCKLHCLQTVFLPRPLPCDALKGTVKRSLPKLHKDMELRQVYIGRKVAGAYKDFALVFFYPKKLIQSVFLYNTPWFYSIFKLCNNCFMYVDIKCSFCGLCNCSKIASFNVPRRRRTCVESARQNKCRRCTLSLGANYLQIVRPSYFADMYATLLKKIVLGG